MRLLLGACAETLETLRLYPVHPRSEQLSPKGVISVRSLVSSDARSHSAVQELEPLR